MARTAALALVLAWLLAGAPAAAEHEVYYRYTVLGFVKDVKGKPVASKQLELVRDKTGFSYLAETDDRGFYLIVSRLGDESVGETLTLKLGRASTKLTAQFDRANHTDERGTRIDLEGAKFVERTAWFRSTLANALGPQKR